MMQVHSGRQCNPSAETVVNKNTLNSRVFLFWIKRVSHFSSIALM